MEIEQPTSDWREDLRSVLKEWRSSGGHGVVLSPDVDGLTSCALLAAEGEVNVVGIYTTTKLVVLDGTTNEDVKNALWLDHDVSLKGVRCIGQHLINLHSTDTLPLREPQSFNPNAWVRQSWKDSFKGRAGRKRDKYPFGTCHMIADAVGFDTGTQVTEQAALMAHADGTWRTVVDYQANADIWYDLMFQGNKFLKFLRDTWHSDPACQSVHAETIQKLLAAGVSPSASRAAIARLLPVVERSLTGNQAIRYTPSSPQKYADKVRSVLETCSKIMGTSPNMGTEVTNVIEGTVESVYPNRVVDFDELMLTEVIFSHAFTDLRTLRYTNNFAF